MLKSKISRRTLVRGAVTASAAAAVTWAAWGQKVRSSWRDIAPMPEAAGEVFGAVANGKFYAMTGMAARFKPMGLVLEYDAANDQWIEKKRMPAPAHHVALATLNNIIYGFGGFRPPMSGPPAFVPIADSWAYDPVKDEWRSCAPMPVAVGAASAASFGGKLYVIGGATLPQGVDGLYPSGRQSVSSEVYMYDPAADSWQRCAPMPTPRNHFVAASVGNTIYAIGGRIGGVFIPVSDDLDIVEPYDPIADRWDEPLQHMPTARSAMAWGVHGDRVYVAGGEYQRLGEFAAFNAVEAYDTAKGQWLLVQPMQHPRHSFAGGVVGDRFFIAGGEAQSGGNGVRAETAAAEALNLNDV